MVYKIEQNYNQIWHEIKVVKLNLFNHVLALFRTKFDCNLAIRYLVFR